MVYLISPAAVLPVWVPAIHFSVSRMGVNLKSGQIFSRKILEYFNFLADARAVKRVRRGFFP
jgi:hypothetical protein